MGFNCGIVGLPNVGKSTLFNALTSTAAAEAANYPFCTIEPNTGRVAVPDERLHKLASLASSAQTIPAQMEFVDIAGLVKGASKGEGLGNQFLSHIRETDAIINMLCCFEDSDITHVEGNVDPIRDLEIIQTELILADLESLEKQQQNLTKKARGNDKDAKAKLDVIDKIKPVLDNGQPARNADLSDDDFIIAKTLQLITFKPNMYVCNVAEDEAATGNQHTKKVLELAAKEGAQAVIISARIEEEIAQLPDDEKQEFITELGLDETGLSKLIKAGYNLLDLITYFTAGPKEARAWTIKCNTKAPQAAGKIHGDFEKGFIRAETIGYNDYIAAGNEANAKANGKMRLEGKDYIVQDGDVMLFRFNV